VLGSYHTYSSKWFCWTSNKIVAVISYIIINMYFNQGQVSNLLSIEITFFHVHCRKKINRARTHTIANVLKCKVIRQHDTFKWCQKSFKPDRRVFNKHVFQSLVGKIRIRVSSCYQVEHLVRSQFFVSFWFLFQKLEIYTQYSCTHKNIENKEVNISKYLKIF